MNTSLTPNERFSQKLELLENGCIEYRGATSDGGYGFFWYSGQNRYAHRMAWFFKHGEPPTDKLVLHKCDNRLCVNLDHLFLGTHQDNTNDMIAKGRQVITYGEARSKITEATARAIKDDLLAGLSSTEISQRQNTNRDIVKAIKRGLSWRNI